MTNLKRLLVLSLAMLALTACDIRQKILMMGDSNMVLSMNTYTNMLFAGYGLGGAVPAWLMTPVAVSGSGLRHLYPIDAQDRANWTQTLKSLAFRDRDFDGIVINLGLNDCTVQPLLGIPFTVARADYDRRIDDFITLLPASVPIIWIDAPYGRPGYNDSCVTEVNLALQRAVTRYRGRITYLNVNNELNALAQDVPAKGVYYRFGPDRLHFADAAKERLAVKIYQLLAPRLH